MRNSLDCLRLETTGHERTHCSGPVAVQQARIGVELDGELIDLGGNQYEFVFTLPNGSAQSNAIFFWTLLTPAAPHEWQDISFTLPEAWTAYHGCIAQVPGSGAGAGRNLGSRQGPVSLARRVSPAQRPIALIWNGTQSP